MTVTEPFCMLFCLPQHSFQSEMELMKTEVLIKFRPTICSVSSKYGDRIMITVNVHIFMQLNFRAPSLC